jgi:YD repeat-containing protein
VAKKWQPLEDGTGRVTYEVNTYDKLGQLTSVRRPGTTMQVHGGITARWLTLPWATTPISPPPPGGELELGWTGLQGARVRVEVTYTTPAYSLTMTGGTQSEEPKITDYPARTVTVTQERSAANAPAGMTVVFQDPVAKIGMIRVWELKGTTWEVRWEGTYAQAQGTGVKEVDQSNVEERVATTRYNAFGEVVARFADGALAEYFHYDAAGRLWRTNAGDGVDKIFLYDAQGNRTSEIRSPGDARGNVDLQLVASAEEAHRDTFNRRIDFAYDAAGRLVQKTDAARLETQGGLTVRQMMVTSTVQDAGQPVPIEMDSGWRYEPGTARVKLTWTNLTVLGSGDVKVRINYLTASTTELGTGGAAGHDSEVFASHEAAQGVTLSWSTKPIASITEITVWKKNGIGVWTEVIRQAPGSTTHQIDLDSASNRWSAEYLEYRPVGSTGDYIRATLTDFGDRAVWAGLATLGAGNYEYRLGITPQGQEERQFGSGTFTIAANRTVTVQTADNTGGIWQRPVVYQKMDRWGNVVELSDPRSADWKTVYAYNANNQMVMQRLPTAGGIQSNSNPSTRIYYDELGRQVAVRDALGYVNATVYDASGNLVREEHADLGVVKHRYNAFGEKVATTDALDNVQSFTYDKGGNLIGVNKGRAPVHVVDANMQLLDPEARDIEERWTYDARGLRLAHFNGENQKTTYRYDLLGNVIEVVQPMGQKTYAAYDAQGHKIAEVDANGYEATWRYDYFGKLLAHTDIGGAKYQYTYDNARQLLKQTNSREQQLAYKYDAAGQVTEIRDTQTGYAVKVTTYVYDLSGRRLVEKTVSGAEVHQDNRLAYDAQGKLRDISDARVRMQLAYDANGNRTSVSTTARYAGKDGEVLHKTTRFFQFDEMNRQKVVDAVDAAGTMDKSTHRLTYDKNGNRTSDTYLGYAVVRNLGGVGADAWTVRQVLGEVEETYAYDKLNRLVEVKRDGMTIDKRSYDAADRVLMSGGNLSTAYLTQMNGLVESGEVGRPDVRINRYDANGRLLHQSVKRADGIALQEISWDPTRPPSGISGSLADFYRAEGYDHAGNVKGYTVFTYEGSTTVKYSTTLERFEGYVGAQGIVSSSAGGNSGMNEQVYDANGHLVEVDDDHLTGNGRTFVNDAEGRALSTLRGGHVQRQLIVNGEVMGRYGVGVHERVPTDSNGYPNFTDVADFNFSFAPVSPTNPTPAPGVYIVQAGDTLQAISRGAYGDSALWYLIAQANGLSSNGDVRVGQVLNIPNRVGTIHNNEGTFKPYDPSKITGDLAPSLPAPGREGCGVVGQILMVVIAVVLTPFIGPVLANAAAQFAGLATDTIDEFSWKQLALSAISAYVPAGLEYAGLAVKSLGPVGNAMANAAIANTVTQGIGVATGLQESFDWKGVAASAAGAGVGAAIGGELGLPTNGTRPASMSPGEFFAKTAFKSFAAGTTAAMFRGGKVAIVQVAADAFGNALGYSLAEAANGGGGGVRLVDGTTISEAENLRRVRAQGEVYAAADTQDLSQPLVVSDAAPSTRNLVSEKAVRDRIFAGGVNGSLGFYFGGLDGVPNPSALPLASAFIGLNGDADGNGYNNFHQALGDIGINGSNAGQSAVYLVQPGMSEADVLADIKNRLGTGFNQQLDKSPDVQGYMADRVSGVKPGQLVNITDFWQSAVGDTVQRAYNHEGGAYFRDVIDNNGTVPIFSKMLGAFNFKGIVANDVLAPQAYRDYARTSLGVDVAVFLASTFMPVKGLGPALRGEVSMLEGRVGFAGLSETVTRINLLATRSKGPTFESLFYETTGLSKYAGPKMPGTLPNGLPRNTVPDLVQPGNAPILPGITDLKNVGVQAMDSQLQAQLSIANANNVPFNVVVAPNTQVYSSVVTATKGTGGNVYVWNPLTKAFAPYR